MYNDRYVVSFFVNLLDDNNDDEGHHSGNTRIILIILKNDANRFDGGAVDSSTPDSWLD